MILEERVEHIMHSQSGEESGNRRGSNILVEVSHNDALFSLVFALGYEMSEILQDVEPRASGDALR